MKTKYKFLVIFIISITLNIFLTGCWDNKDFDNLTLVSAIGVDTAVEKDRIKYTIQLNKSSGSGGGSQGQKPQKITSVVSSTGFTIFEASSNLTKEVGNPPFYGHNNMIIFGEEIAKRGVSPYIDFFIRDHEIHGYTKLTIAKGEAAEIFEKSHYQEEISAEGLEQMINNADITGTIITMELIPFFISLTSNKIDPVATVIELHKGGPDGGNGENLLYITGGAIFKGDRLVGWLDGKEARGFNWVKNSEEINGPVIINTENDGSKRDIKNRVSIRILRTEARIIPEIIADKPEIYINIDTEGVIMENMDSNFRLVNESTIDMLDKRFAQVVKNEIDKCLQKCFLLGSDIFGFEEAIYKKYPQKYKEMENNWDSMFANIPVRLNVKAQIRRTGMLK